MEVEEPRSKLRDRVEAEQKRSPDQVEGSASLDPLQSVGERRQTCWSGGRGYCVHSTRGKLLHVKRSKCGNWSSFDGQESFFLESHAHLYLRSFGFTLKPSDSMQPETPKSPYLNSHLNNNDEAFDPMIADSMANCDYKVEGDGVGFHSNSNGEFALNVEASPLQNPIDFRPDRTCKSGTDNQWDLSPEGPTEYPNALFDPKKKDLRIRGDLGVDLESGREISGNGGSFWSSTRRLLGKAWNRFAQGDFIRTFNGSIPATRTVESHFSFNPKLALAKPATKPVKSANPERKRRNM